MKTVGGSSASGRNAATVKLLQIAGSMALHKSSGTHGALSVDSGKERRAATDQETCTSLSGEPGVGIILEA